MKPHQASNIQFTELNDDSINTTSGMKKFDCWFTCVNALAQPQGPYSEKQIQDGLRNGDISWVSYACNPALDQQWKRNYEIPVFFNLLPKAPTINLYREIFEDYANAHPPQASPKKNPWYFQFNGSRIGPVNETEAEFIVKNRLGKGEIYAWRKGIQGWQPIQQIPELQRMTDLVQKVNGQKDKRAHARYALLAAVEITIDGEIADPLFGICKDISSSGMFVITSNEAPRYTKISFTIKLAKPCNGITDINGRGMIVNNAGVQNEGLGVQFTDIGPELKSLLDHIK